MSEHTGLRSLVTSSLRAALLATPFAVIATLLGLLTVVAIEARGSGLIAHVPEMMLDGGARAMIAVGIAVGAYAFRRPTRLAIGEWSRRHRVPASMAAIAARQLQWLRAVRAVPAMIGLAIGMATAPVYNVAIAVLGEGHPASRALLDAATTYSPFVLALVGYLMGSLLAEVTRRPPVDRGTGARLEARRPDQYLTPTARRLPAVLAAWVIAATVAGALAGRPQPWWPALIAAAVPGVIALCQHHIVRRPQPVVDADALALDDTLRSSAAHALSGGASARLARALDATQHALTDDPFTLGITGTVLAIVGVMGIYGVWAHYGSTHRGRRPERRAAPETPDTPEAVTS